MICHEILTPFANRHALVTGGTGMIGREIVNLLSAAGAKVRIASLDRITVNTQAEHIYGDLTDFGFCKSISRDVDYVFHVAGIKGSIEVTKTKPASFFVPLLMMNTNMLEACRINQVKKVVYTSSIGAYPCAEIFRESDRQDGMPMDMFPGWAKRMAEMQIQAYKIQYGLDNFSIVRPCNVYGPGDNFDPKNAMVIPSLMSRIAAGENPVVIWGDGSVVRDFAFSRDVAEGIMLVLYHGTKGQPFLNLGSGRGVTIRELVETLRSIVEFNYQFDASKPSGFPKRVMDITLARETIGYNPTTSLRSGLQETWDWFMAHRQEYLQRQNYFAAKS